MEAVHHSLRYRGLQRGVFQCMKGLVFDGVEGVSDHLQSQCTKVVALAYRVKDVPLSAFWKKVKIFSSSFHP